MKYWRQGVLAAAAGQAGPVQQQAASEEGPSSSRPQVDRNMDWDWAGGLPYLLAAARDNVDEDVIVVLE